MTDSSWLPLKEVPPATKPLYAEVKAMDERKSSEPTEYLATAPSSCEPAQARLWEILLYWPLLETSGEQTQQNGTVHGTVHAHRAAPACKRLRILQWVPIDDADHDVGIAPPTVGSQQEDWRL